MKIWLSDAGKRFNRDWIFRHLSCTFSAGRIYGIVGPNGSGKSTLLQLLAGALTPTEGKIQWTIDEKNIDVDKVFEHVAICAPYLELIEEMTATEFLEFHGRFKQFLDGVTVERMLELTGLSSSAHKQIRYYSSGMKQRVKLAQAVFTDTAVLLLDEPCTNLDESGYQLYYQMISEYCRDRLVVVSSNEEKELSVCNERLSVQAYK